MVAGGFTRRRASEEKAMPYWQLYYHLVWTTRNRAPLVTPELEPQLHGYLRGKGLDLEGIVHAVGGVQDHVHVVASIPPRVAVAAFVGKLKGASSHWVNHLAEHEGRFDWQEGYGVFSIGRRSLPAVVRYALEQHDRHRMNRLIAWLEQTEEEP
jgi:REP element-mobilizing transposase RayT